MTTISELARAKVNLTLRVHGRRPDGYHEIESLIVFADIGDELHLESGAPVGVHVGGPFGAAIAGENLVSTALARLAEIEPRLVLGAVTLDKRLPVAAGLGGGSADAGALLRAIARANPTRADDVDWSAIAVSLGADVPVCLESASALVRGVGEQVTAHPGLPRLHVVLVNPLVPVPPDKTARVFARLGAPPLGGKSEPSSVSATRIQTMEELLAVMHAAGNDLAAAATAIMPGIADVQAAMAPLPMCMAVCLSGAGPTCFGVFPGPQEAASAAAQLRQSHPGWWIQPAILGP